MIELRFLIEEKYPLLKRLQFRVFSMTMHCGWSPWKDVPEVHAQLDGTFRPSIYAKTPA